MFTKAILFTTLIMATVLPFYVADIATASQTSEIEQKQVQDIKSSNGTESKYKIDETVKERFKSDIRDLIDVEDDNTYEIKSNEIKQEYDSFFRDVIERVRTETNTATLTDAEIDTAINYIFIETIKDEKYKQFLKSYNSSDTTSVDFMEMIGVQMAHATCPATTNPHYKQVRIDISGGRYGIFNFNGNNDLYNVSMKDDPKTCERTYVLSFYDEDHPLIDIVYDRIRLELYKRVHDIEMFVIKNNNVITFDNTWSSTNTYDCVFDIHGCHRTTTKAYTPGQTIYVSNTWNHMMDTFDTNPRLNKVSVP